MKLLLIVTSDECADDVLASLIQEGYIATKIGSSGEFLQYGKTLFLLGVEPADKDHVLAFLQAEKTKIKDSEIEIFVLDTFDNIHTAFSRQHSVIGKYKTN